MNFFIGFTLDRAFVIFRLDDIATLSLSPSAVLHTFKCAFKMIPFSDGYDSGLSRNQNLFRVVSKILVRYDYCTSSVLLLYCSFLIQRKFKEPINIVRFRNGLVVLQNNQTL